MFTNTYRKCSVGSARLTSQDMIIKCRAICRIPILKFLEVCSAEISVFDVLEMFNSFVSNSYHSCSVVILSPGIMSTRPNNTTPEEGRARTARRVVRRDKGLVAALSLPSITLYNMRSIWAKAGNLADDIVFRHTDNSFLTEIWESL